MAAKRNKPGPIVQEANGNKVALCVTPITPKITQGLITNVSIMMIALRFIASLAILIGCLWAARLITATFALSLPAPLLGLLLLFGLLQGGLLRSEYLLPSCNPILKYMALFFIPAGVGLINYLAIFSQYAWLLISVLILVPTLGLLLAGKLASQGRFYD
ncbi:CidA/LrgA family protein [Pseudoalteromonas rubra]|uniref:CidA/LrgA family protein n=2 Tax=Pseudoalteromonas rubra TaxID=43658 RepID=A0A5S3V0D5_9GAMM|nr:CidA/LrgA family protein [Pseudoalteromonas rubra]